MLTTTEAAALLNTALRNVQNYCNRHKVPKRGRDYDISEADIEGMRGELGKVGRPRSKDREKTMKAIEIILDSGTFYIPLEEWNNGTVLIPMDGGQRVLTADDIRANWNAWVSDEISNEQLLTLDELKAQHPSIMVDREA